MAGEGARNPTGRHDSVTGRKGDPLMPDEADQRWCPFHPGADDLRRIAADVAEIPAIQKKALSEKDALKVPDRVAHQYQIAGGKVQLIVADTLPPELRDVGLFVPSSRHLGIGRISTGLGTPHVEPNPDFLGLLLAFQSGTGQRIDFLAINDPASPADNHVDFMSVLQATGESAGADIPFVGALGDRDLANLAASQTLFAIALAKRMGLAKAGKTLLHLTKQTSTTFRSSSAFQRYWTGIAELSGVPGKFTLVPTHDERHPSGLHAGERLFSADWKARRQRGDVEFRLYWIAYVDETRTATTGLTQPWQEGHKELVGMVVFPQADPASEDTQLWAMLSAEMGGNPGNWTANREGTVRGLSTEFGVARQLAYEASQKGRGALLPEQYSCVFDTGQIGEDLTRELRRRRDEKTRACHIDQAP